MTATTWLLSAMEVMWQSALTVIPPALLVAGICRWGACRPATRHLLWLVVLVLPVAIPLLASFRRPAVATQPSYDFREEQPTETPQLALDEPDSVTVTAAPEEIIEADRVEQAVTEPSEAASIDAPHLVETTTPAAPAVSPTPEPTCEKTLRACGVAPGPRTKRELTDVRAGSTRPLVLARGPGPAERPSQPTACDPSPVDETAPAVSSMAGREGVAVFRGLVPIELPDASGISSSLAERWHDAVSVLRVGFATGARSAAAFGATVIQWLQRVMPPAPVRVWLCGAALLLMVQLTAAIRFRQLARRTRPAGADLAGMVTEAATALGLRRAPSAWLSNDRISPMVGGLISPRLIFPAELWSKLDEPGRRAILVHELAHLHRRDHWVRALEAVMTAAFWWQPAAWWARRRVREEAEVCCDAWVTWLLPQGRRAYATALLKTQAFVGNSAAPGSGAGIGVVSVRARRFARRLTMVMSESGKPRLSPLGLVLACVPVFLAWVAAPVFSCPPQDTPAPTPQAEPAVWTPSAVDLPCPTLPPTPTAMGGSYQTYLQPVTPRPLPQLVSNLYSQLVGSTLGTMQPPRRRDSDDRDDLEARLDRLERQLDRLSRQMEELGAARAPAPPVAIARRGRPAVAFAPSADGPVVGKVYRLSGGKLEPLTKLMIREDVPIKVRPTGDGIEIFATPSQHEALAGFIAIIDPSKGEAVIVAPRARGGVPGPGPGPGSMGGPGAGPGSGSGVWVMPDMKAHAKATKAAAKALEAQRRALEKQAEKLREQSEKLQERASQMKDDSRSDAGEKAVQLEQQALAMANQAEQHEKQIEELESQLDAANDAAEALESTTSTESTTSSDSDKDNDDGEDVIADLRAKAESDEKDGSTWFQLGFALHNAKRYDEAREAFERSAKLDYNKMQSIYNIGCGYARAGDADQAFVYLEKAWEAGFNNADHYKNDEDLVSLRKDPRFQTLLESNHVAP